MQPGPPVDFVLPHAPVRARVRVGQHGDESPLPIDQVGIDVERQQVFVTYRYPFRYVMNPLELRSCELLPARGAGEEGTR